MPLQLTVLNLALAHLGEDPTDSLDPNTMLSNPRKVFRFMERTRDQVLGSHHWTAATQYTRITRAATEGNWQFPYVYLLPPKCLRLIDVRGAGHWQRTTWVNPADDADEKPAFAADAEGPLDVAWVRRIGWDAIPSHMEDTLGYYLASLGCFGVNGDASKAADLMKLAKGARIEALSADGVQAGGGEVTFTDPLGAVRASAY